MQTFMANRTHSDSERTMVVLVEGVSTPKYGGSKAGSCIAKQGNLEVALDKSVC